MLWRVRRKKRVMPFVLLALLVAVNAYVIALLLRPQPRTSGEPAAQSTAATTPTGTPSAGSTGSEPSSTPSSPSPSPKSSPSAKVKVKAVPTNRLLMAASVSDAWRATVGDCNTSGTVERSTDSGKTWQRVVKTGLSPIVRLGIDGT